MQLKKVLEESEEIKEWRRKIKLAHLNKERIHQIQEYQVRKLHDLVKDAEADEEVLQKLNDDLEKESQQEGKQRLRSLHTKYVIQQQMKDRDKQRAEAKYEYERDRQQVDDIIKKIQSEDFQALECERKKKLQAKSYMEMTYKEKDERRKKQKEDERLEKEREKQYFESVKNRENDFKAKKALVQDEKDRIFQKICDEKKKQEAEKEYWESVRNDLYIEDMDRKTKIKELEEQEKKAKQKEAMLASAIEQAQLKEEKKRLELEEEKEFKRRLLEKFKEDERLEQYNIVKRKQKELDYKKDIEKQWTEKLNQYKMQKEYELMLLKQQKEDEARKREVIENEKKKLIKENEDILKTYLSKDYQKFTNK